MTESQTRRAARTSRRRRPSLAEVTRSVPVGQQATAVALGLALAGGVAVASSAAPEVPTPEAQPRPEPIDPAARAAADAAVVARLTGQAEVYAQDLAAAAVDSGLSALARLDAVQAAAAELEDVADLSDVEATTAELAALLVEAGVDITETPDLVADPLAALPPVGGPEEEPPAEPLATEATEPAPEIVVAEDPEPQPVVAAPGADVAAAPGSLPPLELALQILALVEAADTLADSVEAEIDSRLDTAIDAAEAYAEYIVEFTGYDNGRIPVDLLCAPDFAPDAWLRCDAAAALDELNVAFAEEFGHDLVVVSSYRDYGTQVATRYRRGGLAAPPGQSNHGLGLAVDFKDFGRVGYFGSPYYAWMAENAAAYGWFHPPQMQPGGNGPKEPWHWEFDPMVLLGYEPTPLPGTD